MRLKFIHITDLHLSSDESELIHNIPIYKVLDSILSYISERVNEFDFILITGDISDTGNLNSYITARTKFEEINLPIYWLPGNHDNLDHISHFNNTQNILGEKCFAKNGYIFLLLNSVAIDESGNNRNRGLISDSELIFLRQCLESNIDREIIIALHHPPVKSGTWKDDRMLLNTQEFFTELKNYKNIRAILYGHQHQEFQVNINNILYYSPPAASFQFSKDVKWAFDTKGPGFGIVSISENGEISTENIFLNIEIYPIYTKRS